MERIKKGLLYGEGSIPILMKKIQFLSCKISIGFQVNCHSCKFKLEAVEFSISLRKKMKFYFKLW